jgi:RNA polymerase sigma factor (sigma-70 family)
MSEMIRWMAAEAESPLGEEELPKRRSGPTAEELRGVGAHSFPGKSESSGLDQVRCESQDPHPFDKLGAGSVPENATRVGHPESVETISDNQDPNTYWDELLDDQRERRIYRGRTVTMLRRYMRYSLETGRMPSLLGREFFRAKVTSYRVTTFEDRVIFVHDMEKCLERLDAFAREVLARVVLQEYEHEQAAQLMGCTRMTVHRKLLEALDTLSDILIAVGLLDSLTSASKNLVKGVKTTIFR